MDARLRNNTVHVDGTVLLRFDIEERRRLAGRGGQWVGLAHSLSEDLAILEHNQAPIPSIKARLTRIGGRCARDGALLDFHPFRPREHRCAQCGAVYTREEDHEWWAMGANLWTAERAVHSAALNLLNPNGRHEALAVDILERFSQQYLDWPNRDNVLGPSRPFFSTYLESIWLLNVCHAVSLLEAGNAQRTRPLLETVRDRIIEPSLELIVQYDEGMSNRQVWNEVAILSALIVLGKHREFEARVDRGTFTRLLRNGLLDDGTWYEGENYHQFAHRGLWYGMQLLTAAGIEVPDELQSRFARGFVTPFLGVLPDETFPSRRDSQYHVSIRQWRFAEWCELGLTFRYDNTLAGVRQTLYDGTVPRVDTGRSRSTADAERNVPASALSRADCSWRALLMADGEPLFNESVRAPSSVLLESQGLAIIRRDAGDSYIALEGGHRGGGHGHPDRLGLTLQYGEHRLLEDPGTGSYVDRSLHWYRSTLAHFAPLVDRKSQPPASAQLLAFEDGGGVGWMVKRARVADDVVATRTVVVCDGYLVDLLEWDSHSGAEHEITLPLCADAEILFPVQWQREGANGGGGLEDGFDFVGELEVAHAPGVLALGIRAQNSVDNDEFIATLNTFWQSPGAIARARVPGPPGTGNVQRYWLRQNAAQGRVLSVWNWKRFGATEVATIGLPETPDGIVRVTTGDGTTAVHARANGLWRIDFEVNGATSSIDLGGLRSLSDADATADTQPSSAHGAEVIHLAGGRATTWQLGEAHYLRTDESWEEAGRPTASVAVSRDEAHLHLRLQTNTGPVVVNENSENPLDNERADVNSDGLQLYFGALDAAGWSMAWLIVPDHQPRITALRPSPAIEVDCEAGENGWEMRVRIPLSVLPLASGRCVFDLVVNERPAYRERRRGQLVLSGGGGFSYLRGDRHERTGALILEL